MAEHKDQLPGGKADKKKPSDFDKDQLAIGMRHEMEHTNDESKAREIAMDHLAEDADYYKKLKLIEKYDRVDKEPDGKQELDYGVEELDKDKKKDIKKRWDGLKKALDNSTAFYNLEEAVEDDEEEPQLPPDGGVEQEDVDAAEADPEEMEDSQEEGGGEMPAWLPEGMEIDSGEASEQPESDDDMEGQEGGEEEEQIAEQLEEGEISDDEAYQMLQEMGHSEAEIRHILHGHTVPQVDEVKRAKAEAEYAGMDHEAEAHQKEMELREQEAQIETEHAKRMKDVEYDRAQKESALSDVEVEHAKRMKELEYEKAQAEAQVNEAQIKAEHQRRMLDLEYETAKKAKELELQFKQKEHEMKMKHSEQLAIQKHKDKLAQSKDDAKFKAQQKAQERKKMKKSEGEDDDLQKMAGWSYSTKSGQFNHPEFGSVNVRPSQSGTGFEIVHGGKVIGHHDSHEGVKSGLTEYLTNLSKPLVVRPASTAVPKAVGEAPKSAAPNMPSDSPYTRENQIAHQQKMREMDRKANLPKVDPATHVYQPIRNKSGQVMDIPEKRYANIPDKPKKV